MQLPERTMQHGTVGGLLNEFRELEYISALSFAAKAMEIRVVCEENKLVCKDFCLCPTPSFNCNICQFPGRDLIVGSNHNISSSTLFSVPAPSSKWKLSSATPNPQELGVRNIQKSAWPPSIAACLKFARNSNMVSCTFTRQIAELDGAIVNFKSSSIIETILIAEDWLDGWEMSQPKEPFGDTGYIGCGSAKWVIYVCLEKVLSLIWVSHRHNLMVKNMHLVKPSKRRCPMKIMLQC
jgi:hypothetical protein